MGGPRAVAIVAWAALAAGGCASIAGLDGINEEACAPDCGAMSDLDGRADGAMGDDSSSGQDGPGSESGPGNEGGRQKDTGTDVGEDSSCGALNSDDNCGACGNKCAATTSSGKSNGCSGPASGAGATCGYTCTKGNLDCNKGTAPDLDGCECSAPGATQAMCCTSGGGDCPVPHHYEGTMASTSFYDCVPAGTIDSQLAQDACQAYLASAAPDAAPSNCMLYNECGDAGMKVQSWCSGAVTGDCLCWFFTGADKGMYLDPMAKGISNPSQCYCDVTSGSYD